MTRTLHVYRADDAWVVRKAGQKASTFRTRDEAVASAVRTARKSSKGQVVVLEPDGRVLNRKTYRMLKIQEPPKQGTLATKKISEAVGKVALKRLKASGE